MDHQSDYLALLRLMRERRSVRRFLDRSVPDAMLEQILEAARWAPSWGNRQAHRFLVVTSRTLIDSLGSAVRNAVSCCLDSCPEDRREEYAAYLKNFEHFTGAPVVVVPIFRRGDDLLAPVMPASGTDGEAPLRPLLESVSSVSAAVMNLLLAAHTLGLGACWMTGPLIAGGALREALRVPEGWEIAALIPLGFPAEEPEAPSRRPLSTLVRHAGDPPESGSEP